MKFVIQTNIFAEEGFESLLTAVDRLGHEKVLVKCIPFDGGLEIVEGRLPLGDREPAIVLGSYTLCRVAKERGWTPGAFLDGLDFLMQRNFWSDKMLNHDAGVVKLWQAYGWLYERYVNEPFFLRPYHDSKSFNGGVFDIDQYNNFLRGLYKLRDVATHEDPPHAQVTPDTLVCVARKKEIHTETRLWFVWDKQKHWPRVVTASGYKRGTMKYYTSPDQVDPEIIKFAEGLALHWRPSDAFVMDVAQTPIGLKVVEVNCLNSSGWYKADLNKLVQALAVL